MAFPTVEDLYNEADNIVQDSSYDIDDYKTLFNDGLKEIAGRVLLPDLETDEEVSTNASYSYIQLPSDYQRNLFYCHNVTRHRKVKVYDSLRLLIRHFSHLEQNGPVFGVAVRGRYLYYQKIPSNSETLRIFYYKYPSVLTNEQSTPECLPEHLAKDLLVYYACKKLFSRIEDAIDDPKTNTKLYEALFEQKIQELKDFIGPEGKEPIEISDELCLDAYIG